MPFCRMSVEHLIVGAARKCEDFRHGIVRLVARPLPPIREKKLLDLRNLDEESEEEEPCARECQRTSQSSE